MARNNKDSKNSTIQKRQIDIAPNHKKVVFSDFKSPKRILTIPKNVQAVAQSPENSRIFSP